MTEFHTCLLPADALPQEAAEYLAHALTAAAYHHDTVTLALSGGQSPKPLLQALSRCACPWRQMQLLLVDERWSNEPEQQNQTLVEAFLQNLPDTVPRPTFYPLLPAQHVEITAADQKTFDQHLESLNRMASRQPAALDMVVLGMGLDGHTASLFPCAEEYDDAMTSTQRYLATSPTTAPHGRISMSFHWLTQAREVILYIPGSDKWARFQALLSDTGITCPIRPLTEALGDRLTVFSSPPVNDLVTDHLASAREVNP